MTDDPKPDRPTPRLPPSGLAEEILGRLARGELAAEPERQVDPDPGPEPEPEPNAAGSAATANTHAGIDRIYTFTDSLQLGQEEEEEREIYETWVEFRLGDELYALPVAQVTEIVRVRNVTPVPHPPFPVIGVINLRGRVVPLLDLRSRLDLPAAPPDARSRVVLVESQKRRIGLLVDSVERVAQLAQSAMQASSEGTEAAEVRGLHLAEGRRTKLLDLAAVLIVKD